MIRFSVCFSPHHILIRGDLWRESTQGIMGNFRTLTWQFGPGRNATHDKYLPQCVPLSYHQTLIFTHWAYKHDLQFTICPWMEQQQKPTLRPYLLSLSDRYIIFASPGVTPDCVIRTGCSPASSRSDAEASKWCRPSQNCLNGLLFSYQSQPVLRV